MLSSVQEKELLNIFFQNIKLQDRDNRSSKDKQRKIGQILAYLEVIHTVVRKYSAKKELFFVDCCAGNCYLSFLVNYYYSKIDPRKLTVSCVDTNGTLMKKALLTARALGFNNMQFHTMDVKNYIPSLPCTLSYSLHACDTATDKALSFAIKNKVSNILSVSCCQHTLQKNLKTSLLKEITKYSVFKKRMVDMIGDTLRAIILEIYGYTTTVFDFVSSSYTEKNIMIRALKGSVRDPVLLKQEYVELKNKFSANIALERYIM